MAHAYGSGFVPAPGDPLTLRTLPLFFEVLRVLLTAGVTVVAEAAFQDGLWRPRLQALADRAHLRIVQCYVEAVVAHERVVGRAPARLAVSRHAPRALAGGRAAHADDALERGFEDWTRAFASFDRVSVTAPSIDVDTTDGYAPDLVGIVDFVNQP
jgi:hypothetical protein